MKFYYHLAVELKTKRVSVDGYLQIPRNLKTSFTTSAVFEKKTFRLYNVNLIPWVDIEPHLDEGIVHACLQSYLQINKYKK